MTKFTKGVAWLEPFYREVEHLIPKHRRITDVKGYSHLQGQGETLGQSSSINDRAFVITLKAWTILESGKRRPYLAYYMLEVFAHELAHVIHWRKEPAHNEYTLRTTAKILRKFAAYSEKRDFNLDVKTCKALGKFY